MRFEDCVAAAVAVIIIGIGVAGEGQPSNRPVASSSPMAEARSGALPVPAAAACARYTPEGMARSASVSFDGTVTAVTPTPLGQRSGPFRLRSTTIFEVHEWFHGGSGTTVTIDIPVERSIDPGPPAFGVGTRLLVSGALPWRASQRVAAWGCGFTRYYDTATADAWRAATSSGVRDLDADRGGVDDRLVEHHPLGIRHG